MRYRVVDTISKVVYQVVSKSGICRESSAKNTYYTNEIRPRSSESNKKIVYGCAITYKSYPMTERSRIVNDRKPFTKTAFALFRSEARSFDRVPGFACDSFVCFDDYVVTRAVLDCE